MSLRAEIVAALADGPLTADEIARTLRVRRADVTDMLAAGGFVRAETPSAGSRRATYWTVQAGGAKASRRVPSHEERILAVLADGEPHSHRELYRLGVMVHSRVAVLRKRGYRIACRKVDDNTYVPARKRGGGVTEARSSYLGFPLLVRERQVIVHAPDGRKLAIVRSVSGARRFVRGYRRADRSST